MALRRLAMALYGLVLLSACSRMEKEPSLPTLEALSAPRDFTAYARPASAAAASQAFAGTLTFDPTVTDSRFTVLQDTYKTTAAGSGPDYRDLPAFRMSFSQVSDRIVPAKRGHLDDESNLWEWVVEPGYIWEESGLNGVSRATLPVALQVSGWNCTLNGVLTFLYRSPGTVSNVQYQFAQETCPQLEIEIVGTAHAALAPGATPEASAAASAFGLELAARMPTRPLSDLPQRYPGIDATAFGSPHDLKPGNLTLFGVVVDGTHYVSDCATRRGKLPFCDDLVYPSFSVAKSLATNLLRMRFEYLHPEVSRQRLADLVPECAHEGHWGDITIDNALDMATGRYVSAKSLVDDDTDTSSMFHATLTHRELVAFACTRYPVQAPPGKVWVYHTSDTYLAGLAMNEYWKRFKPGAGSDAFDDLLAHDLFVQLKLSPTIAATRRTRDAFRFPQFGTGLTFIRDDFAKLGTFLAAGGVGPDGKRLVGAERVAAALQRDPKNTGITIGPNERYNDSFWAKNVQKLIGCAKPVWIAYASGYGGVTLVVAPNDVIYYYVSDGEQHEAWGKAIRAIASIKPLCTNP